MLLGQAGNHGLLYCKGEFQSERNVDISHNLKEGFYVLVIEIDWK